MSNEVLIDLALRMAKLEGPQGEGTIANVLRVLAYAMAAQDRTIDEQKNTIVMLRELAAEQAAAKDKTIEELRKMLVRRAE